MRTIYSVSRAFLAAPVIGKVYFDELLGYYESIADARERTRWDADDRAGVGLWQEVEHDDHISIYPLPDVNCQYIWTIRPEEVFTHEDHHRHRIAREGQDYLLDAWDRELLDWRESLDKLF